MKTTLTLLLICICISASAQRTADEIVSQPVSDTNFYVCERSVLDKIIIDLSYNSHRILSDHDKSILKSAQVVKIDMVYTDFTGNNDLRVLNKHRINKLFGYRKELITDPEIRWNMIRQTACSNEAESMVMFHGMVVHFRPLQGKEAMMRDLGIVGQLPSTADSLKLIARRDNNFGVQMNDTSLIRILGRNSSWKDMLIVCDMTGSMSPYTVQLMVWLGLWNNQKNIHQVVFFNDGDGKPTEEKIIGSIGGIHSTKNNSYEEILKVMRETIAAGGGGERPENDVEALIKAISSYPEAKEIVLIGDNFAPVKDLELLYKVDRPVHVIVCGADLTQVSDDFLQIALQTGGSIHTMHSDLKDLDNYTEGRTLSIEHMNYEFIDGKFILAKQE